MEHTSAVVGKSFKDARGEIFFLEMNGMKFHLMYTKAGMLRGGDYHPDGQRDLILKGQMEVTTRENDHDVSRAYGPNEMIEISANVPHLYRSITDTVMFEWRDGEYKAEYHAPFREQVTKQLKELEE